MRYFRGGFFHCTGTSRAPEQNETTPSQIPCSSEEQCIVMPTSRGAERQLSYGAQTHAAPGRRHPQSWGLACCVGMDHGNTGTPSSTGPGARAGRCGRKKTLKDAKTCKKACGKRCTNFGEVISLTPPLPEPLEITSLLPAKHHVQARSNAF